MLHTVMNYLIQWHISSKWYASRVVGVSEAQVDVRFVGMNKGEVSVAKEVLTIPEKRPT